MIQLASETFYTNRTWSTPIPSIARTSWDDPKWVEMFDQNGYRLTQLEQLYSYSNNQPFVSHRDEKSIRKAWFIDGNPTTGAHLNHAFLFERKGYSGEALEQLQGMAKQNNLIHKLVNYKGKWGIDFSIDYVNTQGNSMEILHFEYDGYELDEILEMKQKVENIVLGVDWEFAAEQVLQKKSEWINLDFFQQSDWKCGYFGLPSERFKMTAWE